MSVFTVRAIFYSLGNTGFKVFFKQQLWNTIYCPTESKINSIIQSIVQSRVQVLYLPMKKASFILLVSSFLGLVSNSVHSPVQSPGFVPTHEKGILHLACEFFPKTCFQSGLVCWHVLVGESSYGRTACPETLLSAVGDLNPFHTWSLPGRKGGLLQKRVFTSCENELLSLR